MRRDNKNTKTEKRPSAWVSAIPLAVLALLLFVVIRCFGGDAINGGSQIALLSATSVCVMLSMGLYGVSWNTLEESIIDNIRARPRRSSSCCSSAPSPARGWSRVSCRR